MEITINKDVIQLGMQTISLEDLFSPDFYRYSNEESSRFNNNFFCVNELFAHLVQPYLAIDYFIANNRAESINVSNAKGEYRLYAIDVANNRGLRLIGCPRGIRFEIAIKAFFIRLASFVYLNYLMLKIPYRKGRIEPKEKFAVLRQKSAIQKFKRFEEISKEFEDSYKKDSIYRLFPTFKRIGWVWNSYFRSRRVINDMKAFYRAQVGPFSAMQVDTFYQRRIVHALLYEKLMESYLPYFRGCTYYTGSNLDRFSVIEERIAKDLGIKTICLPHGLEYGYKFPKGFSCDVFYTNSAFASKVLNNIYNTDKFIYDEIITKRMFELNNVPEHPKHVVFFTEQQEYHVNKAILTELYPLLSNVGLDLLVKLHPGDTKDHYSGCNFTYISDYGESLTGNVCISRKSTVLLEAVYNNSTAIAIITTQKDKSVFDTFPSLQSERIIRTYTIPDLFNEIIKHF